MLQGNLRGAIGELVIGRLGKGTAKAGQSAPWVLEAASEADKAVGERYLARRRPGRGRRGAVLMSPALAELLDAAWAVLGRWEFDEVDEDQMGVDIARLRAALQRVSTPDEVDEVQQ